MKLLCDVCENNVASLICCADEAALCASCDSRVHAANKLASKHQRIPLLSDSSNPVVCDICQERPSFFFCIEDRALLCRDCDVSIHSANALAAKHRRLLLPRLQVGVSPYSTPSQETSSAISLEQANGPLMPLDSLVVDVKKLPGKQAPTTEAANCHHNGGGVFRPPEMSSTRALKKQAVANPTTKCTEKDGGVASQEEANEKGVNKTMTPAAMNAKALRSYLSNKKGMLSSIDAHHKKEAIDNSNRSSTTTISIQRISAGKVPFVAPVLSTLRAALMQEGAFSPGNTHKNANVDNIEGGIDENTGSNSNLGALMEVDDCPPLQSENVSDYLVSGIPGWRLDELLTDLVGGCESGSSLSPPKENNLLGFGTHEDPPWYADLDAMEDSDLSPSQRESVALVSEMPSPPTASGLVTSQGKPTCPAAQPWDFDYLFRDRHHTNEFSVVPDIDSQRPSRLATSSPTRNSVRKKRKFWLDD